MLTTSRIYIAGHRGLVGSAITRSLRAAGYSNLIERTSAQVDLRDGAATEALFAQEKPDYVFLAAAKVGGIVANNNFPVEFLQDNLAIQNNIISAAYRHGVARLLFLGSSCIYPKMAEQPLRESSLLTGPLEPTNRAYALAKIAGIELCWSYNRQYATRYLAAMPTNLYGPGDNYHPENSHVIPGLLRRFHKAKIDAAPSVTVWGSGTPRREFMYSEDMAAACVYLMQLPEERFHALLGNTRIDNTDFEPPLINVGTGTDVSIAELAELISKTVGYKGRIEFDTTKPDGTPRKLMDVSRLNAMGFTPAVDLPDGLQRAYADFSEVINIQQSRQSGS
ncbi:MAG: GDP-L-fucose synthase [Burkholderiaceae bacterium]